MQEVDALEVPPLDIPSSGLSNAQLSDVLRWAYQTYFPKMASESGKLSEMTDRERLIALIQQLPEDKVSELLYYAEHLQAKSRFNRVVVRLSIGDFLSRLGYRALVKKIGGETEILKERFSYL